MAVVTGFFEKETSTAQFVVACPETRKCAVIDSVLGFNLMDASTDVQECNKIKGYIQKNDYKVEWILETHAHADHVSGAVYLKHLFQGSKTGIGSNIVRVQNTFKNIYNLGWLNTDGSQWDHMFADGECFHIGNLEVQALHTPGHTPADVSYYVKNDCVFVGDTIFMADQGTPRCDFPEGSAETLWDSIQKLFSLPSSTRLFTCHDYQPGARPVEYQSTIGHQKSSNIHVKDGTVRENFIQMRKQRDATLSVPKLIIPAVQVNINGGYFPPQEANGHTYLKVPVNLFSSKSTTGVFTLDSKSYNQPTNSN